MTCCNRRGVRAGSSAELPRAWHLSAWSRWTRLLRKSNSLTRFAAAGRPWRALRRARLSVCLDLCRRRISPRNRAYAPPRPAGGLGGSGMGGPGLQPAGLSSVNPLSLGTFFRSLLFASLISASPLDTRPSCGLGRHVACTCRTAPFGSVNGANGRGCSSSRSRSSQACSTGPGLGWSRSHRRSPPPRHRRLRSRFRSYPGLLPFAHRLRRDRGAVSSSLSPASLRTKYMCVSWTRINFL
jgi:hypothetical protein